MITKEYAIKLLKSIDYRKVKYQVINERIKALNLYELIKPSINAISQQDIQDEILKRNEKTLSDYLKHHELCMIMLEKDIERVSKAIDTISKVDIQGATILYMIYFQHKKKKLVANELHIGINTLNDILKNALNLFCKTY